MLKAVLAAVGFFTALSAVAAPSEKLVEQPVKTIKGLRVSGFKGNLTFVSAEGANLTVEARAKSDDQLWRPIVENVDGWIQISVQGPPSKSDWRNVAIPALDLDVKGPSVPLNVVWKEGDITLKGWKASAVMTQHKGKFFAEGGAAPLKISTLEGEASVTGHQGRVTVDNYNARVTLKNVDGGLDLENFSGLLSVDASKGDISLKASKGRTQITGHKGRFEFDVSQGEIGIANSEGPVRGQGEQGSVAIDLKGTADVKIRAESTKVAIGVPRSSGAKVDLGTQDGNFSVSFPLKYDRIEKTKIMKGNLAGKDSGLIFVRTRSGDIRLKPVK
ncbi:MAG TPA: hypothetical protein VFV50_04725 [Bdellovibrionales bacterium]|nr:hypothetical protein [Bdellovibrionales bacterium]